MPSLDKSVVDMVAENGLLHEPFDNGDSAMAMKLLRELMDM